MGEDDGCSTCSGVKLHPRLVFPQANAYKHIGCQETEGQSEMRKHDKHTQTQTYIQAREKMSWLMSFGNRRGLASARRAQ